MDSVKSNEAEAWPRDFDFRAEVSEQQELLETEQHVADNSEGQGHEHD